MDKCSTLASADIVVPNQEACMSSDDIVALSFIVLQGTSGDRECNQASWTWSHTRQIHLLFFAPLPDPNLKHSTTLRDLVIDVCSEEFHHQWLIPLETLALDEVCRAETRH